MTDTAQNEVKDKAALPESASEAAAPAEAKQPGEAAGRPQAPAVKAILGKKIGMTRVYDEAGRFIPVTVLEAGPCSVVQVKTKNDDGYDSVQLSFGQAKEKNVSKPMLGHYKKAGVPAGEWLQEVRIGKAEGFVPGQEVRATNFAPGDLVDVSGYNKGKGFAGVVKRHRFKGGPKTHGQSDRWRAPGSSGGQRPQKVYKGIRGPGHMGHDWTTVLRAKVIRVDADTNLLLLEGSVPGPNGAFVKVQQTARPKKYKKATAHAPAAAKKGAKPAAKPAAPAKK